MESARRERSRAEAEALQYYARLLTPQQIAALKIPLPPKRGKMPRLRGLTPGAQIATRNQFWESELAALIRWGDSLTGTQRSALRAAAKAVEEQAVKETPAFDREALPDPTKGYSWRSDATEAGFSAQELERLERDKLLIEDVQLKQSFQAYTGAGPFFITSDSLLNGFHVLFEDSFRELEYRRVSQLRTALERMLKDAGASAASSTLPGMKVAWRQAQLAAGPAMVLLGSSPELFDLDVRAEIERQVALVRTADGNALPEWLGPPSPRFLAIDYRRFRPTGFYADGYYLRDYFRAVRWLQVVPFRLDRDSESLALLLLARASVEDSNSWARRQPLQMYSRWLGRTEERNLVRAGRVFTSTYPRPELTAAMVESWRSDITARGDSEDDYPVNEDVRLPPAGVPNAEPIQYHILGTLEFPEAQLFQKLADAGEGVSGLTLAAFLGSDLGRRNLSVGALTVVNAERKMSVAPRRREADLYAGYLQVLASLFTPPEPDAPEFMRNDAWAAKSCQAALASWAQMRHTFSLQAKESANYLGMISVPPGFIEPNPQFLHHFARLCGWSEEQFADDGAFQPCGLREAEEIRTEASWIEEVTRKNAGVPGYDFLRDLGPLSRDLDYFRKCEAHGVISGELRGAALQEFNAKVVAEMRAEADDIASGRTAPKSGSSQLQQRWRELERMAYQLEAMVQKQLRRRPWTDDESAVLRAYGETLASIMGYDGNSWLNPRDDAPRWAEVHRDPRVGRVLAESVGRPRKLYVLYPWNGGEILCRGSVMSYYEYWESGPKTDEEWKTKLDSPEAPPVPVWIEAIMAR